MPTDYLKELNETQLEPVLHKDGPLMVIAGAGSGKTRVLTYRIAHLMQQGNRCLLNTIIDFYQQSFT